MKLLQHDKKYKALLVAPGLRAGRGLKPDYLKEDEETIHVAPGLRAGRGLKLSGGEVEIIEYP